MQYIIYRPGEGYMVGIFTNKTAAIQVAMALDAHVFKTKKAYERAKYAGALHQVREVEDKNGKETSR